VSSGDEFCACTDRALAGIQGEYKLVDDILVYGATQEELLHRIKLVFERCLEWGITLSKTKYQVGPIVQFAGYVVSKEGTTQDPKLVDAISKFPAPKDVTNLRSLIGLVNRFNDSNPDLKHAMASWQGLLKESNVYLWSEVHEAALTKVKEIITNPRAPTLRFCVAHPGADGRLQNWCWILPGPDGGWEQDPAFDPGWIPFSKPGGDELRCGRARFPGNPVGHREMPLVSRWHGIYGGN
jgi:hypothetical protein